MIICIAITQMEDKKILKNFRGNWLSLEYIPSRLEKTITDFKDLHKEFCDHEDKYGDEDEACDAAEEYWYDEC